MFEYLILVIVLIIIIIDQPFINFYFKYKKILISLLKLILILLVFIHFTKNWNLQGKNIASIISGISLIGLILIYSSSTDHKGIEDKIARRVFKRITWFLIWIISIIHIINSF